EMTLLPLLIALSYGRWVESYREADEDRWCYQTVVLARAVATVIGDRLEAWDLLEAAADLEPLLLNRSDPSADLLTLYAPERHAETRSRSSPCFLAGNDHA